MHYHIVRSGSVAGQLSESLNNPACAIEGEFLDAANPRVALGSALPYARKHTFIRELLIVSEHNTYHIGEFAILRQVMGTWPARH